MTTEEAAAEIKQEEPNTSVDENEEAIGEWMELMGADLQLKVCGLE
jgi:hypothetical protein